MQQVKVLQVGGQLGIAIPRSLARALGWMKGDYVAVHTRDGDIVLRNDTRRLVRFTREPVHRRAEERAINAG